MAEEAEKLEKKNNIAIVNVIESSELQNQE